MASLVPTLKNRGELLNHILDVKDLPVIVQSLDVDILTKLIGHIGLEDSGQIIAAATADQVKGLLDQDLWHSKSPGRDEKFDPDRFNLWIEVMMDNGSAEAVRLLLELDEDLVTLGLSRLVWVLNAHDPVLRSDSFLDYSLSQEFDDYVVIAKHESGWDSICGVLAELNESDDDVLSRLLERCCRITGEYIEDNGDLYDVLTAGEMLEEDVSASRQERREGLGFVTPSSAAVFLNQARLASLEEILAEDTMDLQTRAYFKATREWNELVSRPQTGNSPAKATVLPADDPRVIRFIRTLQNAEVLIASDHQMIGWDGADAERHHLPLANAMNRLNEAEPELYFQRLNELSYLSNTLISGCGFKGRSFKPKEAIEAAMSVCNLGGEYMIRKSGGAGGKLTDEHWTGRLRETDMVRLFKAGYKILFDDVVMFTAGTLLEAVDRQRTGKRDKREAVEFRQPAEMLRAAIAAGNPWEFMEQLDYLQPYFEGETVMAAQGLLRELPTMSNAVCRMGGHRVSPFIWSRNQIMTVRRFLKKNLGAAGHRAPRKEGASKKPNKKKGADQ